jgi:hypothetical protein
MNQSVLSLVEKEHKRSASGKIRNIDDDYVNNKGDIANSDTDEDGESRTEKSESTTLNKESSKLKAPNEADLENERLMLLVTDLSRRLQNAQFSK